MSLSLFVPTALDLAGWAGTVVAALAFIGLGRLVTRGQAPPEAGLVAGWGVAAVVLTLWGVVTSVPLTAPAAVLAVVGLATLAVPRRGLSRAAWTSLARVVVLALPLLVVLASARPAEPDTFLNLLPNAAYLYDHGVFPAAGRPDAHSYLPTAPYNLQIAAYVASLAAPQFPVNGLLAFNIVLLVAASLFLARLVAGSEDADTAPSWSATAMGLLLATALDPGFVPRVALASYSEPSVTVCLLFAGWAAVRGQYALLAAALAALVNAKQDSVALVLAVLAVAALLALAGERRGRVLGALVLAALPAAALYLAWRWYVLTRMPAGELTLMPRADWQLGATGLILLNMVRTIAGKGVFYAVLAATVAAALWRGRRGLDPAARLGAMLGGVFVLYSAALMVAYVALFPGTMGTDAHSYFRYSTHLSLLMMAAIVLLLREGVAPRVPRLAGALAIVAILALPPALAPLLRFDLEAPALRVWQLARAAAPLIGAGDKVALVMPGDNGSVDAMLETVLRTSPPRRPDAALDAVANLAPDTLARLASQGYGKIVLSCATRPIAGVPQGRGAILGRSVLGLADEGWTVLAIVPYPPAQGRFSHVLSWEPLCLG